MKLPEFLIRVTSFSKILTAVLFVSFPFAGFFIGLKYEEQFTNYLEDRTTLNQYIPKSSSPDNQDISSAIPDSVGADWKTYRNTKFRYSIKYPQELEVYARVESLPGNEELRQLPTTCCIGIYNKEGIILGVDAFQEKRTLEQFKNELLSKNPKEVSNLKTINVLGKDALQYNFTTNKIVTLIIENTLYDFLYAEGDNYLADQILSTFQFLP